MEENESNALLDKGAVNRARRVLMKRYIARQVLIARLGALALVTLCFLQGPVRAQGMTAVIVIFPSVGLAPGQSLRLTLFNPAAETIRAEARIHGGANFLLCDGSVKFIRAGAFQSFDFHRSDILLAGEEGTGRIQLRASVSLTFSEGIKPVAASMEILDVTDGTSSFVFVGETLPSQSGGSGNDFLNDGFPNDIMDGIAQGQTLRVTLFNPPPSGAEARPRHVGGHVKVFDKTGSVLGQSDELVIPAGEFRSFDFNRDEIALPGEPGTNRLQTRIKPFFTFSSGRLSPVLASIEIVDNSTGKTRVLSGSQCLVFFLGGIPG
jgi:prepilin-type processing-associated H-X9-DG protein